MRKKEVLVTGGSGFLGSHVADLLTENGYNVTIFDNKKSSHHKDNQKIIVGDITDHTLVKKIVKKKHAVFHLAAEADIEASNIDIINSIKSNILGTTYLLNESVKNNISRFIYASSIYVNSNSGGIYTITKQTSESLIKNFHNLYNLDFTILRYGSLYGTRANDFNWINKTIKKALTTGILERSGDGEEIREYIHIYDAAKATVKSLDSKFKNQFIMLTGNQKIKIRDLLLMIKEMLNNKVKIRYSKQRFENHYKITPYSFRPNVAMKYNLEKHIELGEGILNTIYEIYDNLDKKKIKIDKIL